MRTLLIKEGISSSFNDSLVFFDVHTHTLTHAGLKLKISIFFRVLPYL